MALGKNLAKNGRRGDFGGNKMDGQRIYTVWHYLYAAASSWRVIFHKLVERQLAACRAHHAERDGYYRSG